MSTRNNMKAKYTLASAKLLDALANNLYKQSWFSRANYAVGVYFDYFKSYTKSNNIDMFD